MKKTPHCAGAAWWKGDTAMKRNSMSMMACLQDSSLNLHCLDLEVYKMSEGRKTQVVLLDDRLLDIITQPKLYAGELLDIVASHFNLKEKEYFGLSFKDDTGHHHWLQQDRRVLEHDFPRKNGPLVLYFAVRFFIETIAYLRDNPTIELFFLQSKQAIYRGQIECDSDTVFELAAYALQVTDGNYTNDATAKKCLKSLPLLPTSALQEHPSIEYCEEQVLGYYRSLAGQSRGSAIVNYMNIVENLPTYGVHYYEVKDKSSIPWWLGLGYQGISLYDYTDKKVPRRVFAWKQLENLYFRDKKFSIEVHDPKRIVHALSSFNLYEDAIHEPLEEFDDLSDAISDPTTQVSVSRRTFSPGNVNVHAWFAATPQLTKCIWSMAVSQHQFYLDRKQSKSQIPQMRSMTDIATELCRSTSSLQNSATSGGSGGISRSNSCHSLSVSLSTHNSKAELTVDDIEASRAAHRDMFAALKARRDLLEESVRKKTEELKALCIKEGELTGKLPKDIPLAPGEPIPQVRKRVRTGFTLSPQIINNHASDNEANLSKLELEFDVQDKIVKAAHQLAQDKTVAKSVRKKRKQSYHRAVQKLKDLEKTLNDYRRFAGKTPVTIRGSVEDLSDDSRDYLEEAGRYLDISCQPDQISCLPDHISCLPDQISCQPDQILCQPDQIMFQPDQISCQPDQISCQPDQISCQPDQILCLLDQILCLTDQI
ncbi:FERM domain-containing protein 4B [Lamellibrachia satsuma]|nr:FERM domain-containing protein 4B [Lamellibrachia satsuma]